jgi:hypothetical protein
MKLVHIACLCAVLLSSGCFQSSPGGLQGVWASTTTSMGTQSVRREAVEYTFDGDSAVRVFEWRITSNDGEQSVTLRVESTATFTVDESVSPARIDFTNIQNIDSPSDVEFAIAAAISGDAERTVQILFGSARDSTLLNKGLFRKEGDRLTLKFVSTTDYPTDIDPPGIVELVRTSGLFRF